MPCNDSLIDKYETYMKPILYELVFAHNRYKSKIFNLYPIFIINYQICIMYAVKVSKFQKQIILNKMKAQKY